jgi:hypothetical protein
MNAQPRLANQRRTPDQRGCRLRLVCHVRLVRRPKGLWTFGRGGSLRTIPDEASASSRRSEVEPIRRLRLTRKAVAARSSP